MKGWDLARADDRRVGWSTAGRIVAWAGRRVLSGLSGLTHVCEKPSTDQPKLPEALVPVSGTLPSNRFSGEPERKVDHLSSLNFPP